MVNWYELKIIWRLEKIWVINWLLDFVYSFICPLIHSITHAFIHSFAHSFIHSFVRSFIHSFVHQFHSYIHWFTSLLMCVWMCLFTIDTNWKYRVNWNSINTWKWKQQQFKETESKTGEIKVTNLCISPLDIYSKWSNKVCNKSWRSITFKVESSKQCFCSSSPIVWERARSKSKPVSRPSPKI